LNESAASNDPDRLNHSPGKKEDHSMTFNIKLKIAKGLFELDATIELRSKRKKPQINSGVPETPPSRE
jgi:hypothetical protein